MSTQRKTIKPVSVVPYDDRWPTTFRQEADRLLHLLHPEGVSIHHIGSTSVAGLCAKPVIDMLIEASDLATVDRATPAFERRGYVAKGEYGIPGRRYFSSRDGVRAEGPRACVPPRQPTRREASGVSGLPPGSSGGGG